MSILVLELFDELLSDSFRFRKVDFYKLKGIQKRDRREWPVPLWNEIIKTSS